MKILVTGSNGFIGKPLVKALKNNGHSVITYSSVDGDICNKVNLEKFKTMNIDFIYHLAGKVYVPDSWNYPDHFMRVNIQGTVNILELARDVNAPIVYISAYVYGIPKELPVNENHLVSPSNPYAFSKYTAESVCKFYSDNYGVPVTVIRPFNVYGPGQDGRFLIPHITNQIYLHNKVEVKDLLPKRDYVYIDDFTQALLATQLEVRQFEIFNIGSGQSHSVDELIGMVAGLLRCCPRILCEDIRRENEIMDLYADIDKASEILNWRPRVSITEGINQVIQQLKQDIGS
jgi:nucleoside-diphosphate-sugar epimerase